MQISLGGPKNIIIARAGGGGSSSSSGSSGGSSFSGGSSAVVAGTSGGSDGPVWPALLFFVFILLLYFVITKLKKAKGLDISVSLPEGYIDRQSQEAKELEKYFVTAENSFMTFQKAWSEFDMPAIKNITTTHYYKKMVLELNVLKNYQRQNIVNSPEFISIGIKADESYEKGFSVFLTSKAEDRLVDLKEDTDIFVDNALFSETWHFVKKGQKYLLDGISQGTEDSSKFDKSISNFALHNGFYYDPDFGWLMMPTRGAIFSLSGFGRADINNHVIGYYKDKVVEFYSYEPSAGVGLKPFVVAQAILPKRYDNILVTQKSWYNFKPKSKNLVKVETESNDFNKKFAVWSTKPEQATSFELLATNFMEKIYKQKYEINIEVVDNVLYLYSPSDNVDYSEMLTVLSWAFEEMKM
jgi:hypothetical protein